MAMGVGKVLLGQIMNIKHIFNIGDFLFVGDGKGQLKQYFTQDPTKFRDWGDVCNGPVNTMALSEDGRFLFTGGEDLHLRQWFIDDRLLFYDYGKIHDSAINSIKCTPDGEYIFTAGNDNLLKQFNMKDCVLFKNWGKLHKSGPITTMVMSRDGKNLFTGGEDLHVHQIYLDQIHQYLSNIQANKMQILDEKLSKDYGIYHKDGITTMILSCNGSFLFTCGEDGSLCQYDVSKSC